MSDIEKRIKLLLVEEFGVAPIFLIGYVGRKQIEVVYDRDEMDTILMRGAMAQYGFVPETEDEEAYD